MLKNKIDTLCRAIEDLVLAGEANIPARLAALLGMKTESLEEMFIYLTTLPLQEYIAQRRLVHARDLPGYPPLCFEDLAAGTLPKAPAENETIPDAADLPLGYDLIRSSDYARTAHPDHAAICRILQALQEHGMTAADFDDIWDTAQLFGADIFDVIADSARYEELFTQISEGAMNDMNDPSPAGDDGAFWLGLDF